MIELEKDIEQTFVDWVIRQRGITYKWEGSRKKLDRIVVTSTGNILLIEFKKKTGSKLSPHQKRIVTEMGYRNAPVLVTNNVEEAKRFYKEHC